MLSPRAITMQKWYSNGFKSIKALTDVDVLMKQVQRALGKLGSREEEKHLMFSDLANKLKVGVKMLVNRYKVDDLNTLAQCFSVHYGVQERDYDLLTGGNNQARRKMNETVEAYIKRYLEIDEKIQLSIDNMSPEEQDMFRIREQRIAIENFVRGVRSDMQTDVKLEKPKN
ncbi:hypothetical protein QAD02_012510 [Eretmocerus hayati]|uniref:Uncharacterized protein n=1 Tax=Eretmocerus hayati TaxID=131215 RepID=A0ACC2P0S6_9HYME|nr:hypothetical protein QAD02_012510 [Eretmocerus hayati]